VLATYLRFAQELFGQSPPLLSHAPRVDAMAQMRRAIDPGIRRFAGLAEIVAAYVAARRRDPLGALNLLKPATWPGRVRLILNSVQRKW
jgi:hypothetical protein